MGKNSGAVCRKCRREGVKLFFKGIRCDTAKCPMEKQNRSNPPGMHSWRRGRISDYGVHLREKQKVKRYYGVLEKQFMLYFKKAERMRGNTGECLLGLLERRLDNVLYKMNFVTSRRTGRQMISHGHIQVNGRKVDIPSYLVKQGDTVSIKDAERPRKKVKTHLEAEGSPAVQEWLQVNPSAFEGVVTALPNRDHVQIPVEEQLIVEMCSR